MTEERKSTDVAVYILSEDTIPDLVTETGMDADRWLRVLAGDRSFGIQSKIYVMPSEVSWKALLAKYIAHVKACEGTSFIDDDSLDDAVSLTPVDRIVLRELHEEG